MAELVAGDFPKVILRAADGARAEVYLHGAHVTSWTTPDGRERLYMSERATFQPNAALRGGIPVVFPQFAGLGPLVKHGFARITSWEYLGASADASGAATAHFHLQDGTETHPIWDHGFRLEVRVTVGGPRLRVSLQVTNADPQPFEFTAALHTYLRVREIADVTVEGLAHLAYREHGAGAVQEQSPLRVEGEIDRIYWDVPGPVTVRDPEQTLQVAATGFADVVVWNPGPVLSDSLADMEPGGYHHMLCVEAAIIGRPVRLSPGGEWRGEQVISAT